MRLINKSKTFKVGWLTSEIVINFFKSNWIDILNNTCLMYRYSFDIETSTNDDVVWYIHIIIEQAKFYFEAEKITFIYKETKNLAWGENTFWLDYKIK